MTDLESRLVEDKGLRDSALRIFKADLALIRGDLHDRSAGARIATRVGDATMDMLDDGIDYAAANKGKVAAVLAAVALWFARGPIIDGLARLLAPDADDEEPEQPDDRLDED